MRSLLHTWRVWWLALALVVAPQLSFVHALSHIAPVGHAAAQAGHDDNHRQKVPEQSCALCLSIAHLGHAAPGGHVWASPDATYATPSAQPYAHAALAAPAHFQARAPPVPL